MELKFVASTDLFSDLCLTPPDGQVCHLVLLHEEYERQQRQHYNSRVAASWCFMDDNNSIFAQSFLFVWTAAKSCHSKIKSAPPALLTHSPQNWLFSFYAFFLLIQWKKWFSNFLLICILKYFGLLTAAACSFCKSSLMAWRRSSSQVTHILIWLCHLNLIAGQ